MVILKTIFFTGLTYFGLSVLAGEEIQPEILFVLVPIIFLCVYLFSGKNKQKQETVQSSEDENKIEPLEKNIIPDFNKDNRNIVKDLVLETNKKIAQALRQTSNMTLRKNLQLLYSQVNSIDYNYAQRKISYDQASAELNSIQQDAETLIKELETFNTSFATEVDMSFIKETDYYKFFGLIPNATLNEIKLAYMNKIKQFHPDKVSGGNQREKANAQKICQKVNRAYKELTDRIKRQSVEKDTIFL